MKFKNSGRYAVPSDEDFEPNSNGEVLKNLLGIKSKAEIEALEAKELERAEIELLEIITNDHQFAAEDICNIHELWLGDIYPFAGKYRSVNISKDDFQFAISNRIKPLMTIFEKDYLQRYTPCHYTDINELAMVLSVVHVELILIHPFREGNGRVARLLADLMAMQAGYPPLNYAAIDQIENPDGFSRYIAAIHAGLKGDYEPMRQIFKKLLEQSS